MNKTELTPDIINRLTQVAEELDKQRDHGGDIVREMIAERSTIHLSRLNPTDDEECRNYAGYAGHDGQGLPFIYLGSRESKGQPVHRLLYPHLLSVRSFPAGKVDGALNLMAGPVWNTDGVPVVLVEGQTDQDEGAPGEGTREEWV